MTPLLWYLAGVLTPFALCAVLVAAYIWNERRQARKLGLFSEEDAG